MQVGCLPEGADEGVRLTILVPAAQCVEGFFSQDDLLCDDRIAVYISFLGDVGLAEVLWGCPQIWAFSIKIAKLRGWVAHRLQLILVDSLSRGQGVTPIGQDGSSGAVLTLRVWRASKIIGQRKIIPTLPDWGQEEGKAGTYTTEVKIAPGRWPKRPVGLV